MIDKLGMAIKESLTFEYAVGNLFREKCIMERNKRYTATLVSAVLNGESEVTFEKQVLKRKSGQTVIVPGGVEHSSRTVSTSYDVVYAHVMYKVLGSIDLLSLFGLPVGIDGEDSRRISEILLDLVKNQEEESIWIHSAREQELGFQLLQILLSLATEKESAAELLNHCQRLTPVLEMMQRAFPDHNLTVGDMAKCLNLSPSRFQHLFKSVLKESPTSYLKRIRIQHAQALLMRTGLSVVEIAQQSGYNDPFHFSRAFKAYCGESPTHFRERALV